MATPKSPERAFALQKYLLLHSQHDALQKHLDQISSSIPSHSISPARRPHHRDSSLSTTSTNSSDSISSSPESTSYAQQRSSSISPSPSPSSQRPSLVKRRSSLPIVIDESILHEMEEEKGKIKEVNMAIKKTLTDLLNCESVRGDRRYRMWVQTRLMDAERELKAGRHGRKRSGSLGGEVRGFEVLV